MIAPTTTDAQKATIRSLKKALALPRSMQTPEGTDKDGVEHLPAMALDPLVANR